MREFQEELAEAVANLDRHYSELKATARQRLGSLFNAGDYPESLRGHVLHRVRFSHRWSPRTTCSSSTRSSTSRSASGCSPGSTRRCGWPRRRSPPNWPSWCRHLTERLSGQEDGKPKIFRDSAVENLTEFFQRFRELNVRSNEQLDQLGGRRPAGHPRRRAAGTCGTTPGCGSTSPRRCRRVQSVLDGLLVDRPRRNILRRPK